MTKPLQYCIGVVSAALLGLTVWGAFGISRHLIVAVDKWGSSAPDLKPTLATLNRPCGIRNVKSSANYSTFYSEGSLMPCGTLAEVATSVVKAGNAVVQTQLVERATTPHVTAAMDQFGAAAVHLSETADNLSITAQSLTGTAKAATVTLTAATGAIQTLTLDARTANDLLVQLRPLIASYTATGNDLDTTIKTANGIMSSQNVTIMLANGAQFTTTAVQLEQKLSQCTLHPTLPCVLKSDILFGAQVSGYLLR
jgi:hypothetical protein